MENNKKEQLEALKVLADFQNKMISNAEILIEELTTVKKEDTNVLNGTLSLINEESEKLSKEDINSAVTILADALRTQDDKNIAEALEQELLPMLKKVRDVVAEFNN